jgi:short-subunit dehydrogenase
MVCACDVRQDQDVNQFVQQTIQTFGRLDVAFANAGYGLFASVMETTDQQARDMYETNFYGTLRVVKAAGSAMLKNGGGHLIICSSAASEIALPMYGLYASTKAAQDSIAGALRAEVAHKHVYVTSVHPIGTSSEFFEGARDRSHHPLFKLNTPARLTQTPEHVAKAIVRCIRRPCPEVWPSPASRFGLAVTTAFPRLAARVMRVRSKNRYQSKGKDKSRPTGPSDVPPAD